ncbi:hypothetical protein [Rickettsiella endosymbiont of Rhagonycha lignosa]|uniref:hypothetical protein n=1 Tax=Rickettsiella endosymbiont of Rhagonycha lignosa TaxID=3077937 RepID=UPI00313D9BD5
MQKVEIKLDKIVNSLPLDTFANNQALFNDYIKLKELLNSPVSPELLADVIRQLKANLFYQEFKLNADSLFLKTLINKVTDFRIIEGLLKISDIHFSQQEEKFLNQRIDTLSSLFFLKEELLELQKDENENDQKDPDLEGNFFEVYLQDLKKLKTILSSASTSLSNIEWFFESDLFEFMLGVADSSDGEPVDIYEALLENTEIKTEKEFRDHKKLLGRIKNDKFEYQEFYRVLRNSPAISKAIAFQINLSEKFSTLKMLSPIARKAFVNNLIKHDGDLNLIKFKR